MTTALKWKLDFPKTAERFAAWWEGEIIDRPPLNLHLHVKREYKGPVSQHKTLREKWLDVEFRVDEAIGRLAQQDFIADTLPVLMPNLGPELASTLFGCELEWADDPHSSQTNWSVPVVRDPEKDWPRIAAMPPRFEGNVYWRAMAAMTDLAIAKSEGRYLVGHTDVHDAYDTMAALRDPQMLCVDLVDCPQLVQPAAMHVAEAILELYRRLYAKISATGYGFTSWIPLYHDGPASISCCDFWAMVSPRMAREMILPAILPMIDPFERSIFHLDGPGALKHLDLLLELPQLQAVQWVYGAGNHPATRWIDVYRRVQAAGKSNMVYCDLPEHAMEILKALGPRGMWFVVGMPFENIAAAEAYMAEVERVSAGWR